MPRTRCKIVESKLPSHDFEVTWEDGIYTVEIRNHRAIVPDYIAKVLTRTGDFFRVIRDAWHEPIKKVLLIRGGGIGDVLLTTPLVRHLSQTENCTVDYLTSESSAPLLQHNPYIRQVLTCRLSGWPDIQDTNTEFDLEAARDDYDAVVDLRWHPERAEFAGIREHRVDSFFHAMERECGVTERGLDLFVTSDEKRWAREFVVDRPSIAYVWNSTTRNRNWTTKQHEAVITALVRADFNVVVLCQYPVEIRGNVTNLSGKLTLRETCAVIDSCDLTLTPDTGLFHVAQALRKSTVCYFGCFPTTARGTAPLTVVNDAQACEHGPCRSYECKHRGTSLENICLNVAPESVVRQIKEVLGQTNAGQLEFAQSDCREAAACSNDYLRDCVHRVLHHAEHTGTCAGDQATGNQGGRIGGRCRFGD